MMLEVGAGGGGMQVVERDLVMLYTPARGSRFGCSCP